MKSLLAAVAVLALAASPSLACEWMKSAQKESQSVSIIDVQPSQSAKQSTPAKDVQPGQVQLTETPAEKPAKDE